METIVKMLFKDLVMTFAKFNAKVAQKIKTY